jgi:hypothetical protein
LQTVVAGRQVSVYVQAGDVSKTGVRKELTEPPLRGHHHTLRARALVKLGDVDLSHGGRGWRGFADRCEVLSDIARECR